MTIPFTFFRVFILYLLHFIFLSNIVLLIWVEICIVKAFAEELVYIPCSMSKFAFTILVIINISWLKYNFWCDVYFGFEVTSPGAMPSLARTGATRLSVGVPVLSQITLHLSILCTCFLAFTPIWNLNLGAICLFRTLRRAHPVYKQKLICNIAVNIGYWTTSNFRALIWGVYVHL